MNLPSSVVCVMPTVDWLNDARQRASLSRSSIVRAVQRAACCAVRSASLESKTDSEQGQGENHESDARRSRPRAIRC